MSTANITLLKTKLVPQRTRSRLVDRPRLHSLFEQSEYIPKLTAIYAPAGYGKSTLISQYMQSHPDVQFAWYSLDDNDNNLDIFTQYFLAAYELNTRGQKNADSDFPTNASSSLSTANAKARLSALFNRIIYSDQTVRFVLDDFHLMTNPRVLECIEWMLRSMPAQMSLVITSREKPALECMVDLAAQGDLLEIASKQLKFTLDETESFMAGSDDLQLDKQSIHTLYDRTEGWIAATQLAFHALQDQSNPKEFVTRFSGSDKDIVNYLGAMVLRKQSEEVQHFFLYTSILKQLSASLCEHVTGNKNAEALLRQISNDGLFLFELDREQKWFRYHHLFGEFLVERFKAQSPEDFKATALRVAQWYLDRKDIHEAIHYYLLAESFDEAVGLMLENVSELVQYKGHHEILLRWIEKLPEAYITEEPRLAICLAWSLIFTRHLDQVAGILQQIENCLQEENSGQSTSDNTWIQWNLEMLYAMHDTMCGKAEASLLKTQRWLSDWPKAPPFERGTVLGVHGASCIQLLDLKTARKVLREAMKEFSACDAEYGQTWMSFMYALVLTKQGHINEAQHLLERALQTANDKMGELSLASALLHLGMGYVCYLTNEIEACREHLSKGFFSIEEHGHVETMHLAYLTQSSLLLRDGRESESLKVLFDAGDFGRRLGLHHYDCAIIAERIRRLLHNGQVEEAKTLFSEYGFDKVQDSDHGFTAYETLQINVLELRFLFKNQRYDDAITLASALLDECQKVGLVLENMVVSIIQIRALFEVAQVNKSYRLLNKLVESAASERLMSPFIDEQIYLAPLWANLFKRYDQSVSTESGSNVDAFVRELGKTIQKDSAANEFAEVRERHTLAIDEALSKKEKEILGYLDQGLTNKQLADTLFVTVSTIKWHLTHIYSKLGVKNRVEAVKAFQLRK